MQKETVLIMDYRYDEGARPRKDLICPCITTRFINNGGGIQSSIPLILEKWIDTESNKQQNKVTSKS